MPISSEPPPNDPPAGTARARIKGVNQETTWEVGYWLLLTGDPDFSDITTLATDIFGAWVDTLLTRQTNQTTTHEVAVEYFTGAGTILASSFADHTGPTSGGGAPASAACVLSWAIVDTYRGGKPRTYLPGVPLTALSTVRVLDDGYVADTRTAAANFLDAVNGFTTANITTCTLGVLHFFSGGLALDPPTFDPYIGVGVQKRVCSQRRRLGREI